LQAGHRQSDGFNAIFNPKNFSYNPDRDGYRNDNVSGSLSFRFAPDQEISAQAFRSRLNAQFDAGPASMTAPLRRSRAIHCEPQTVDGILDERALRAETRDDSNPSPDSGHRAFYSPAPHSPQNEAVAGPLDGPCGAARGVDRTTPLWSLRKPASLA
jgi:hypothetical protein